MSLTNRVGVVMSFVGVWTLIAAPHAQDTAILALASMALLLSGSVAIIWEKSAA